MTAKKLFAYLMTGMMYAAILSGSMAAIVAAWKFIPGTVVEMFQRGVVDGLVMVVVSILMAVMLLALGYLGTMLTRVTFHVITKGWDKWHEW